MNKLLSSSAHFLLIIFTSKKWKYYKKSPAILNFHQVKSSLFAPFSYLLNLVLSV